MLRYSSALAALLLAGLARAADAPSVWIPVDAATLDRARGGFELPGGLQVSLGIDRLVSINGAVVAQNSLQIADIGHMTAAEAQAAQGALASTQVVQNGPRNTVQDALPSSALGAIVVQNTLSDQMIRAQTIISSQVNSASLLKAINFQSSVTDAVQAALRPR